MIYKLHFNTYSDIGTHRFFGLGFDYIISSFKSQ